MSTYSKGESQGKPGHIPWPEIDISRQAGAYPVARDCLKDTSCSNHWRALTDSLSIFYWKSQGKPGHIPWPEIDISRQAGAYPVARDRLEDVSCSLL
ncbi:hypothetical protein PGTUg99_025376 [Puccinia graminis f. sp. tritici]|uniref:Uncharacterized protein n=1 Tax=Puccinia graminis f. sp. tritici TaxID=56615 RepID=A0A5B0P673_PUCGR|nr:hypothetical protein PGTUg99_025376 [Puccinia graminis f. sp. tritici]